MPYTDDAPDRPDPILAAARIGELTRLTLWLEQPGLTLDDVRRYTGERLERLYPIDFHIYRQRWQALEDGGRPAVAGMLGEVDGRVEELRRVLLAAETTE